MYQREGRVLYGRPLLHLHHARADTVYTYAVGCVMAGHCSRHVLKQVRVSVLRPSSIVIQIYTYDNGTFRSWV